MTLQQSARSEGAFDHIDLNTLRKAIETCRQGWQDQAGETVTAAAAALLAHLAGAE